MLSLKQDSDSLLKKGFFLQKIWKLDECLLLLHKEVSISIWKQLLWQVYFPVNLNYEEEIFLWKLVECIQPYTCIIETWHKRRRQTKYPKVLPKRQGYFPYRWFLYHRGSYKIRKISQDLPRSQKFVPQNLILSSRVQESWSAWKFLPRESLYKENILKSILKSRHIHTWLNIQNSNGRSLLNPKTIFSHDITT